MPKCQTRTGLSWKPGRGRISLALVQGRGKVIECPSPAYLGPDGMPQPCLQPLPDPPAEAEALQYQQDMQPVRALTRRRGSVRDSLRGRRVGRPYDRGVARPRRQTRAYN